MILRPELLGGWLAGALLALTLAGTLLPHLLLGGDTYIRIHDHLDGNAARAAALSRGGYLFAGTGVIVDPILGGQPRWMFGKPTELYYLWFAVLPPLAALIVNELVQRIVAFVGMLVLVRRHLLPASPHLDIIAPFAAAAFSLLPFWPFGGIAVAATPLVVSAYLDARARARVGAALLTAVAFGVLTNPVYVGAFLLASLGALWALDWLREPRKAAGPAFWFLALLGAAHVASEYQILHASLSGILQATHRSDMASDGDALTAALAAGWRNFWSGHSHAATGQMPLILPLAAVALVAAYTVQRRAAPDLRRRLLVACAAAVVSALVYGLWRYEPVRHAWQATGLPYANLGRFHWLQPLIWGAIFALSLGIVSRVGAPWPRATTALIAVLGCIQLGFGFVRTDLVQEARRRSISYDEFVSAGLFDDIRAAIAADPSSYRVGSVGLHPSVALFNGFRTIDGYQGLYPLSYKKAFRAVIADELAKDEKLQRYFDDWGNRVYLFSTDLDRAGCSFLCTRRRAPADISLGFDARAFKALGGRFVLSVSRISNADAIGLAPRGLFSRAGSPWVIHLYEAR